LIYSYTISENTIYGGQSMNNKIIEKTKVLINILSNWRSIYYFREFFISYVNKIDGLSKISVGKKHLFREYVLGGSCQREFLYYSVTFAKQYIKMLADEIFADKESKKLYEKIFMRSAYGSHFINGWDKYFDSSVSFEKKYMMIRSKISSDCVFRGNYFATRKNLLKRYFEIQLSNKDKYRLPINWFEICVFIYNNGLIYLSKEQLDGIKDKVFVDVGAFVGDSSMILSQFTHNKVLAFEPNVDYFKKLKTTIGLNNMEKKITPFNIALDSEKRFTKISDYGVGSIVSNDSKGALKTNTLDNIINKKYKNIGLIKMDVEGYEMNILKGAKNTIEKYHPTLLISIYHNGEQYINIPKYLNDKYSDIYNFKFVDCNPIHPHSEKVLMCIPKA